MNNLIVQKFGGTSVANTERFQAVADLVVDSINSGTNVAVVVSAMAGETQRLINLAKNFKKLLILENTMLSFLQGNKFQRRY